MPLGIVIDIPKTREALRTAFSVAAKKIRTDCRFWTCCACEASIVAAPGLDNIVTQENGGEMSFACVCYGCLSQLVGRGQLLEPRPDEPAAAWRYLSR